MSSSRSLPFAPWTPAQQTPLDLVRQAKQSSLSIWAPTEAVQRLDAHPDILATFRAHACRYAADVALEHYYRDADGRFALCRSFTFAELDALSTSMAAYIRSEWADLCGLATPVAALPIISAKHPAVYVAMLAALKLGLAIVPIDPETTPAARQWLILSELTASNGQPHSEPMQTETAQTSGMLVLADREQAVPLKGLVDGGGQGQSVRVLELEAALEACLDEVRSEPRSPAAHLAEPVVPVGGIDRDTPAYMIFTSGSTGRPKGIVMSRGALSAGVGSLTTLPPLFDHLRNRMLQFSPIHFDVSILEIMFCLAPTRSAPVDGRVEPSCTLVVATHREMLLDLAETIRTTATSHACLTPTVAGLVAPDASVAGLAFLALSGEPIPAELAARWVQARSDGLVPTELWCGYGPSETFFTSLRPLNRAWIDGMPSLAQPVALNSKDLGPPLPTCLYACLNPETLLPVPLGELGELFIGGPQVMSRYLGHPELNQRALFSDASGTRWYRTGDLVAMAPGRRGSVLFDRRAVSSGSYVKHNGLRIELGEIDATALRVDRVDACFTDVLDLPFDCSDGSAPQQQRRQALVSFVSLRSITRSSPGPPSNDDGKADAAVTTATADAARRLARSDTAVKALLRTIWQEWSRSLAAYMVPAYLVPLPVLPLAPTGKIDTGFLHRTFGACDADGIDAFARPDDAADADGHPLSPAALEQLRRLLEAMVDDGLLLPSQAASALERPSALGSRRLSTLGISSLDRIRLGSLLNRLYGAAAREAREAVVYGDSTLLAIAFKLSGTAAAHGDAEPDTEATAPFHVKDVERLSPSLQAIGLGVADIDDVIPATPSQLGIIHSTLSHPGSSRDELAFHVDPASPDYAADSRVYQRAFEATLQRHSVLRTVFVVEASSGDAVWQVVVRPEAFLRLCDVPSDPTILFGRPCVSFRALTADDGSVRRVCLGLHHAVYDGFSLSVVLRDLVQFVRQQVIGEPILQAPPAARFAALARATLDPDARRAAQTHFGASLAKAAKLDFPRYDPALLSAADAARIVPSEHVTVVVPFGLTELDQICAGLGGDGDGDNAYLGSSALLQAGLASALADVAHGPDVLYGTLCSGRRIAVDGIEEMVGPVLTTVAVSLGDVAGKAADRVALAREIQQQVDVGEKHAPFLTLKEQLQCMASTSPSTAAASAQALTVLFTLQRFPRWTLPSANDGDRTRQLLSRDRSALDQILGYPIVTEVWPDADAEDAAGVNGCSFRCRFDPSRLHRKDAELLLQRWLDAFVDVVGRAGRDAALAQRLHAWAATRRLASDAEEPRSAAMPALLTAPALLHDALADRVKRTPQKIAIQYRNEDFVTYAELQARAIVYAHAVAEAMPRGTASRSVVLSTSLGRNADVVALLFALSSLGAPYVFADVEKWPTSRLDHVVEQVEPFLWLCSDEGERQRVADRHPRFSGKLATLGSLQSNPCSDAERLRSYPQFSAGEVTASSPAYFIFTSGTTSMPKGVVISQSNLAHLIDGVIPALDAHEAHRWLLYASWTFDASILEVFACLLSGGCLCMDDAEATVSSTAEVANRLRVSFAQLTPTVGSIVEPAAIPHLTDLILGGEPLTPQLVHKWRSHVQLFNCYGPSECTVIAAMDNVTRDPKPYISIGRPFGHNAIRILGLDRSSVVDVGRGKVGEIAICGPQVGRYLDRGREEGVLLDTSEIEGGDGGGGLVYRTGDLGFRNGDGTITCLGRKDSELKIRGQRIDTEAIVSTIVAAVPSVQHVSVDYFAFDQEDQAASSPSALSDRKRLVAFVVPAVQPAAGSDREPGCRTDPEALAIVGQALHACTSQLTAASVPSWILAVSAVPRTSSGKVDSRRLRQLAVDAHRQGLLTSVSASATDPLLKRTQTTVEEIARSASPSQRLLLPTWIELLGIRDAFDTEASLFQLGGDSITTIKLIGRLQALGFRCTMADLAQHGSFSALAALLESLPVPHKSASAVANSGAAEEGQAERDAPYVAYSLLPPDLDQTSTVMQACQQMGIASDEVEDVLPATPMQAGIFAVSEEHPGLYVDRFEYVYRGPASPPTLEPASKPASIPQLVESALRSVAARNPILRTSLVRLGSRVYQVVLGIDAAMRRARGGAAGRREDDGNQDRYLAFMVSTSASDGRTTLSIDIHHALFDAWSWQLVEEQLQQACRLLIGGGADGTATVAAHLAFHHFVGAGLEPASLEAAAKYWRGYMERSRLLSFPGKGTGFAEEGITRHFSSVGARWTDRSGPLRRQTGFTVSDLVRTAVGLAISTRLSDEEDDVMIGIVTSGRSAPMAGIDRVVGPCLATLPLRVPVRLAKEQSCRHLIERVRRDHLASQAHEQLGLRAIIDTSEHKGATQIFDVLLTFVNLEDRAASDDDVLVRAKGGEPPHGTDEERICEQPYPLTLEVFKEGQELSLCAKFDRTVLLREDAVWLLRHIVAALNRLVDGSEARFEPAMLITDDERRFVDGLSESNVGRDRKTAHPTLALMLRAQASRLAKKIAIHDDRDRFVSYAQLFSRSFRAASRLRACGIGPGDIVPLLMHKGLDLYVSIFAVIMTGAAFANLSLEAPLELLRYSVDELLQAKHAIVDDGADPQIVALIAQPHTLSDLGIRQANAATSADDHDEELVSTDSAEVVEALSAMDERLPCYIGLTSGTSGRPKAVQVTHRNIVAFLEGGREAFLLEWSSRNLAFASHVFDAFYQDIFVTLLVHGACLIVATKDNLASNLEGIMDRMDVSDTHLTPTVSLLVSPERVPKLRSILITGEQVTPSVRKRWIEAGTTTQNAYGPSETSVGVSTHTFEQHGVPPPFISIGRPFGDTRIDVVDENLAPVPIGAVGELVVSGTQVAGYLRSGSATAFVESPFMAGHRLYRTGDLGCLHGNGTLECLGRRDFQVKLHGQRIEAESVVSVLVELGKSLGLREAAVDVVEVRGQKRLVAFLSFEVEAVAADASRRSALASSSGFVGKALLVELMPRIQTLRTSAATRLNGYMCPSLWLPLTSLPRNTSNKLDRKALPTLLTDAVLSDLVQAQQQQASSASSEPLSPIELQIRDVWAAVLDRKSDEVPRNVAFGLVGIDSLGLIRINALLRGRGFATAVSTLVSHPTISSLAGYFARNGASSDCVSASASKAVAAAAPAAALVAEARLAGIPEADIEAIVACSPPQKNLVAAIEREPSAYTSTFRYTVTVPGSFTPAEAEELVWQACNDVADDHAILRALFISSASAKVGALLVLIKEERGALCSDDGPDTLPAKLLCARPRISIHRDATAADVNRLCVELCLSHLYFDGWSMQILERDLLRHLRTRIGGRDGAALAKASDAEPRPRPSYLDLCRFYVDGNRASATAFWTDYLRAVRLPQFPAPIEPFSYGSESLPFANAGIYRSSRALRLVEAAAAFGVSASTVVQAALAMVLSHREQGSSDVLFGLIASGRALDFGRLEDVFGPCMVPIPFRTSIDQSATLAAFLKHVSDQYARTLSHQLLDMRSIINALPLRTYERIFSVLLAFPHLEPRGGAGGADEETDPILEAVPPQEDGEEESATSRLEELRLPCIIEATISADSVSFGCIHQTDVLPTPAVASMFGELLDCLGWIESCARKSQTAALLGESQLKLGIGSVTIMGAVDASPAVAEAAEATRHVAPEDALERLLCNVLSDTVGLAGTHFGTADNFFALGADSLGLMRLALALQRAGVRVTIELMVKHATVRTLAAAIREGDLWEGRRPDDDDGDDGESRSETDSSVSESASGSGSESVGLSVSTSTDMVSLEASTASFKPTSTVEALSSHFFVPSSDGASGGLQREWLFMVHDYTGFVHSYGKLARFSQVLERRFKVYGVMDPDVGSARSRFSSVAEMARSYLYGALRLVYDASGPTPQRLELSLGGWSFGGLVALEMTRLALERRAEVLSDLGLEASIAIEVRGLVLVDTMLWPLGMAIPGTEHLDEPSTGERVTERDEMLTIQKVKAKRMMEAYAPAVAADEGEVEGEVEGDKEVNRLGWTKRIHVGLVKAAPQEGWQTRPAEVQAVELSRTNGLERAVPASWITTIDVGSTHAEMFADNHAAETARAVAELLSSPWGLRFS
ncbi:hypothetical protein ACQY0O_006058 [Thecaphora frezii]